MLCSIIIKLSFSNILEGEIHIVYLETYRGLCHGTDAISAENIKRDGFILGSSKDSWCGDGIYFYDIKAKAWWAANRKCKQIKDDRGQRIEPAVVFADIIDIAKDEIFDMRVHKDLVEFERAVSPMLERGMLCVAGIEDETERTIILRSMLISYFADCNNRKLIIGNFRQRPQPLYEHAIEFANSLDMVFGIETIYCVKDKDVISNIS